MSDKKPDTELTGDPEGKPHRQIDPKTGQQLAYVVLSEEERLSGFIEPVRTSYVHDKCGGLTQMSQSIAETYARDPYFYGGTFCAICGKHFPVGENGEFKWAGTNQRVGTVSLKEEKKEKESE